MVDTSMLDVALDALAHGFTVFPPAEDGTKRPAGQWKAYQQRLPTVDEVRCWYANGRTGIGVVTGAVSGNLEMLEFEGRAVDDNLLEHYQDLADAAGLADLLARVIDGYAETTPSGGVHLLYRVTGAIHPNLKLARRPRDDGTVDVLIETRGEGGYVVIAPSHGLVHPTGLGWVLLHGGLDHVAVISEDERDQLHRIARALDELPPEPATPPRAATVPTLLHDDGPRPGDSYNTAPDAAAQTLQVLERHGWTEVFRRPHDGHDDIHLRRPGKALGTSAVLHMDAGTLVNFSSSVLQFEPEHGYTPFAVLTLLDHGGDYQRAARTLRPHDPTAPPFPIARGTLTTTTTTHTTAGTAAPSDSQHLPDTFWNSRPILAHIRQAARARLVPPDAVLGAVLARVAAITPHPVEIPSPIATPVGLTFYAALTGPPGAGKSGAANLAAELLPAPPGVLDRLPIGSGEGMVEVLFDVVDEEGDGGKKRKVKRQTRHAAIFHIDEGQVLTDLANRQGTTLLPTLRTAYTHGTLGNTNASTERKRIVDGRSYVYGVTLGIQPELAAPLLADTAGGTPQRFVWLAATDPDMTAGITWPGPLPWEPPDIGNLEAYAVIRGGYKRYQLDIDATIADDLVTDRIARQQPGNTVVGDEHEMLVRLKIAALLALLDQRLNIRPDDWQLAAIITTTSRAVRRTVEGTIAATEHLKEQAQLERHTRRELAVDDTKTARALSSAAGSIARVVLKHHEAGDHNMPVGCTRQCMRDAVGGRHKQLITGADAIDEALVRHYIVEVEGRYVPGDARPA